MTLLQLVRSEEEHGLDEQKKMSNLIRGPDRRLPATRFRVALGAGRMTLLRQLLAESVLLVAAGAALGWALAALATPMLARKLAVAGYELSFHMDTHVFWFTLGIAALAAIAFGTAPLYSVHCASRLRWQ